MLQFESSAQVIALPHSQKELHFKHFYFKVTIEPGHEKTCLMSYVKDKGADQPAHPHSLISAFVFAA